MARQTVEARFRAAAQAAQDAPGDHGDHGDDGGATNPVVPGAPPQPGRRLTQGAALATTVLAGTGTTIQFPLTTTTVVAAALLPVWLPRLARWRGARAVSVLGLVAVGWGLLLSSGTDHAVDGALAEATSVQVLTALGGLGLLLWARTLVPLELLAGAYGLGMLATGLQDAAGSPNAWKFELGLATTTIVLAATQATRRPWVSAVALLALGGVGAVNDTRSGLGFAAAAAGVVVWQALRAARPGRTSAGAQLRLSLLVAAAGYALYTGAVALMVSGALGSGLAARTQAQVDSGGGSLLLGGRPELTATAALFQHRPGGYGLGVVPDREDVLIAKEAMARVGIQAENGYVDNYMFGGHFELHSVLADAWATMGWGGIAFMLGVVLLLVNALLTLLAQRTASPLAVFWTLYALWWTGFGPLYSNLPDIVFAVVLTALPAAAARAPWGAVTSGDVPRPVPLGPAPSATSADTP